MTSLELLATTKARDSYYNRIQWTGEEYLLEEIIEILKRENGICYVTTDA